MSFRKLKDQCNLLLVQKSSCGLSTVLSLLLELNCILSYGKLVFKAHPFDLLNIRLLNLTHRLLMLVFQSLETLLVLVSTGLKSLVLSMLNRFTLLSESILELSFGHIHLQFPLIALISK